jgi:hypothetical protein
MRLLCLDKQRNQHSLILKKAIKPKLMDKKRTLWHQILGRIFQFLLTPIGITVLTDVEVMANPPQADILLLKRENLPFPTEQLERLPDGIRDSRAPQILIEFKATQSLSKDTFIQAAAYEYFYKESQELSDDDIQTFVISSIQPQQANREQYGYHITVQPGVYQSDNMAFNHITLISLNELPDELHNAWLTCLASKKLKRLKAFNLLKTEGFKFITLPFKWFLLELLQLISTKGDDDMSLNFTPEQIKEMGEMWASDLFTPEERKAFFSTRPLEERLANTNPSEVMSYFKPEQRLAGIPPEQRLAGLSLEEIEAYIKQQREQS